MKADTVTKDFISDAYIFADVFNYYIYGGKQIIFPENLTERDSAKITLPYGADKTRVPVQKFRDVQKLYTIMTDGKMEYILYSVENQSEIHYAMAVKNNLYDALDYARQVEEASKSHRKDIKQKKKIQKKPTPGEFLGGFWKEDKLIPSITITIYFGSDQWDAPLSLFDMMEISDSRILSCMDNYHVHLIAPALMADEEIMKFQSNFREVMLFIKYSKDKEKLNKVLKENEKRFREVERRAVDVIELITNAGLHYDEREAKVDMCQAIQEMRIESERIGELKGELRGEQKKAKEDAKNFYDMGIEIEKVAQGVGYPVETVKQWLGLST